MKRMIDEVVILLVESSRPWNCRTMWQTLPKTSNDKATKSKKMNLRIIVADLTTSNDKGFQIKGSYNNI